MRILLDECVPASFARDLVGHEVSTVRQMGWAGLRNGVLLGNASGRFGIFLTVDRKLPAQQDLSKYDIAVVVLRSTTSDIAALRKLVPALLAALPGAKRGEATLIG